MKYDVVVVGGGPSGLSAALILGRARLRVLLCDSGTPRNAKARHVQGFVTRDGTPPGGFRREGHRELEAYPSVERRDARVERVEGERGRFRVSLAGGDAVEAERVLICTGMVDDLPPLPGLAELWGTSVFQCPYCHGWEVRDQALGLIAAVAPHLDLAWLLTSWSKDVVVFTNGELALESDQLEGLSRAGIRVEMRPVVAAIGAEGRLMCLELAEGERVVRDALFVKPIQRPTALVTGLGLELDGDGLIKVDELQQTTRPGVYAAGDAASRMQTAILGAAAGARAAYAIHKDVTLGRVRGEAPR